MGLIYFYYQILDMNLLEKINKKIYIPGVLLVILIAVGFFLRVYKLGYQSYWIDEGFTYMQMEAVHKHGYPLLESGVVDVKDIILPYFLQIPRFFTEDPFWLRMIPAIFGTASIYVVFLLARYLWNPIVGLFASFLITFSYWHIAWSRQLRPYSLLVLSIFIAMLFLALHERTQRKRYLFWALISIVCAIASKSAGILLLVPFIAYIFLKKFYKLGIFSLLILAGGIYLFKNMLISALGMAVVNYSGYYVGGYLWQYFGILFFLTIAGWFFAIKDGKRNWRIHVVAGIFFISVVAFFSFFVFVNQRRYMFFITPLLFMYAAYALALLSHTMKKYAFILVVLIVFDAFTTHALIFWPKNTFELEDYTPQPNFNKAYRAIKKEMKDSDCVASPYPYMDKIYLGKSTWALPISYTGRDQDSTGQTKNEHYSGTKMLYQRKTPIDNYLTSAINDCNSTYFIIDAMSQFRVSQKMMAYLTRYGKVIIADDVLPPQSIRVYRIDARAIGGLVVRKPKANTEQ